MCRLIQSAVCALALLCISTEAKEKPRLNFIFILADDLGWTGLGCYGSPFYETPNIDRLAREGMRFTQAYAAAPLCSPTRASFLTGKYPARLHVTDYIPGEKFPNAKLLPPPDWSKRLPAGETTIAQRLKAAGYVTASIGKWHLGGPEARPEHFGFDFSVAGIPRGSPASYFSPYKNAYLKDGPPGEFLSDRLTDETIKFIEANKDKPFFIYLPHFAVHTPIRAKADVTEKYQKKKNSGSLHTNAVYAALTESVDDSVGRIMKELDELKLADRTVVVFNSDNGGMIKVTSNSPLRSGKASPYEGGVRVPLIVRWAGVTRQGSLCDAPVITADFYPTILEMAEVQDATDHVSDGESLVPLLKQDGGLKRKEIFWHYPHYNNGNAGQATPFSAIRCGDFRLVQFLEDDRVELYDLKKDIGETKNLASAMPETANDLKTKLDRWRKEVGAQLPIPNAAYDPKKGGEKGTP